eukprot:GFUD01089654.1.p1 GENE.GFUD01089654.1~~GFUD01089654.1.p1  ORF type:complete len:100 (-),score=26.45 GFUD01089654.1:65-364(-)
MVHVREGGVVVVDVEGDGEQLWHDDVVGDQGGEAGVVLHETFHLVAILQLGDDVVSGWIQDVPCLILTWQGLSEFPLVELMPLSCSMLSKFPWYSMSNT